MKRCYQGLAIVTTNKTFYENAPNSCEIRQYWASKSFKHWSFSLKAAWTVAL